LTDQPAPALPTADEGTAPKPRRHPRGSVQRRHVENLWLACILVGLLSLITFVSIWVVHAETPPRAAAPAPAAAAPSVTDWISAIGGAIGALGTAGALWLGAVTFRRQVRDQHRAQAAAATVMVTRVGRLATVELHNGSALPIYAIKLVATYPDANDVSAEFFVGPPHAPVTANNWAFAEGMSAYAEFRDSADRKWRRHLAGKLEEIDRR
jgi:hypothetical protein